MCAVFGVCAAVRVRFGLLCHVCVGILCVHPPSHTRTGTWILTDEPVLEPPRLLASTLAARGLPPDSFVTFSHGETRVMPVAPAAAQRGQEEEGKEREEGKEGEGATPVLPFGSVAAASDAKL